MTEVNQAEVETIALKAIIAALKKDGYDLSRLVGSATLSALEGEDDGANPQHKMAAISRVIELCGKHSNGQ